MFCRKCGAQNPDDADRCENCGAPLEDVRLPAKDRRAEIASFFGRAPDDGGDALGTASLVLGIGSLILLFFVWIGNIIGLGLGIAGIVLGAKRTSGGTGRVLSALGAALNGIVVGIYVGGGIALTNCVGV